MGREGKVVEAKVQREVAKRIPGVWDQKLPMHPKIHHHASVAAGKSIRKNNVGACTKNARYAEKQDAWAKFAKTATSRTTATT